MKNLIKSKIYKNNLANILYYKNNLSHLFLNDKLLNQDKEIVICGMPRSGSTVVYNIVKDILKIDQKFVYVKDNKDYIEAVNKGYRLIKCHSNLPIIKNRVRSNKAIGIFTYRNLLDIAVSLIQKKKNTINEIVEKQILFHISLKALDLAKIKNMHKICYEKDISQLKNLTIKIFRILGVKFSNDELDFIINKYSKEKVNSIGKNIIKTNQQKQFKLNATSGFHENHFFDGKSDKYIDFLDTTTIRLLANQTKDYNTFFSYHSLKHYSYE